MGGNSYNESHGQYYGIRVPSTADAGSFPYRSGQAAQSHLTSGITPSACSTTQAVLAKPQQHYSRSNQSSGREYNSSPVLLLSYQASVQTSCRHRHYDCDMSAMSQGATMARCVYATTYRRDEATEVWGSVPHDRTRVSGKKKSRWVTSFRVLTLDACLPHV